MNRFSHILSSNYSAISQPSWNLCQKYALWPWWLNEYEDDDDCDDDGRHWSLISLKLNHKIEDGSPSWKHYVLYIILTFLEAILYIFHWSLLYVILFILSFLEAILYILLVIAIWSFSPSWKLYYIFYWSLLYVHSHLLGSYIMRRRPPTWSPTGGLVQWRQWTLVISCGSQKM